MRSLALGVAALPFVAACAAAAPTVHAVPSSSVRAVPTVAAAPTSRVPAASEPEGRVVRPCPVDSPELGAAKSALEAFGDRVRALAPKDDVRPAAEALARLVAGPCFALLDGDFPGAEAFTSSASLRAFWSSGGEGWAWQALGYADDERPIVHTIPTPRTALSLEATPRHPLAPFLLCSESDARCGAETVGWMRRASHAFETFDRLRALEHAGAHDDQGECEKRATALPELERFQAFRACMADTQTPHTTLPLGAFKAPREGWLVVRGRRGHYAFCDEVRAYDLATGAALVARSCGGLALRSDGSVDGQKTRANQAPRDDAGRVSVDALREAAFAMVLTDLVDHRVVPSGFGWYLPEGIPLARREGFSGGAFGGSYRSSSGQTTLAFSWRARGALVTRSTLTWPEDYNDAARAHAVELLAIAESTFVSGCAPSVPPANVLDGGAHGKVSSIDADEGTLDATQRGLAESLNRVAKSRACRRP